MEKKYLQLVPTGESKETLKKYEELWNKIKDLIRSITNNTHNDDEKYMKIKFDSDNELTLKKTLVFRNIIVIRHSVQAPFFRQSSLYISFL